MVIAAGPAAASGSETRALVLPGYFYPESITAAPDGSLFVSSIATGEMVRFAPGSSDPTPFVGGVNVQTAGVMVDATRGVLWACAVDLFTNTPSELRAFDLETGDRVASYSMLDGGLCADITLAGGDVYVTDTLNGQIVRLTGTAPGSATGGTFAVWSSDPRFRPPVGAFLGINGIAFDGDQTIYTTNYSTGELFAVPMGPGGSAAEAVEIALDEPLANPDGIRWRGAHLYVADNVKGLLRINPRTGMTKLIDGSLDQPTSLVIVGDGAWVTEGQVLRLPSGQPILPFRVVWVCL